MVEIIQLQKSWATIAAEGTDKGFASRIGANIGYKNV